MPVSVHLKFPWMPCHIISPNFNFVLISSEYFFQGPSSWIVDNSCKSPRSFSYFYTFASIKFSYCFYFVWTRIYTLFINICTYLKTLLQNEKSHLTNETPMTTFTRQHKDKRSKTHFPPPHHQWLSSSIWWTLLLSHDRNVLNNFDISCDPRFTPSLVRTVACPRSCSLWPTTKPQR